MLLTISLSQLQNRKPTLHINLFTPFPLERPYWKSAILWFTALLDKLQCIFSVGHIDPFLYSRHTNPAGRSTLGVGLHMDEKNEQFLRLRAVIAKTGKPKASIYRDIHLGTFPAPEKIGARAVAWRLSRILRWMQAPSAYQED